MSTVNDNSDQQQLEQLKLEISLDTQSDKPWTEQGLNEKIVQKIHSCIENGTRTKTKHLFCSFNFHFI
jgi:hypothetical protein